MARKKKQHLLRKKAYNSLTELKNEIVAKGIEKIVEFDGWRLKTNRGTYGLFDGTVTFTEDK